MFSITVGYRRLGAIAAGLAIAIGGVAAGASAAQAQDLLPRCLAADMELSASAHRDACSRVLDDGPLGVWMRRVALQSRARALLRLGQDEAAIADLRAAIELEPEEPSLHVALAEAFSGSRPDEAGEAYAEALALTPASAPERRALVAAAYVDHLDRAARRASERGDSRTAIKALNAALDWASADRDRYLTRRARAWMALDERAEAEADWASAIEAAPDQPWAYAERGLFLKSVGEVDGAISDLTAAFARRGAAPGFAPPTDALVELLAARGDALLAAGDDFAAAAEFERVYDIASEPALRGAQAHFLDRAWRYETRREFGASQETLRSAASFFDAVGSKARALGFRARLVALRGALGEDGGLADEAARIAAAVETLPEPDAADRAALASAAADPASALLLTAVGLQRIGAHEAAAALLERALARVEDGRGAFPVLEAMGDMETARGDFAAAAAAYQKALAAAPDARSRADVLLKFAEGAEAAGDPANAAAALDEAVRLDPERAEAWRRRGALRMRAGAAQAAVGDFDRALALAPAAPAYHRARAEAHLALGRNDAAALDVARALLFDPDDPKALAMRGRLHEAAGRKREAAADYSAAIERDPEDAWTRNARGFLRFESGDLDGALEDFSAAVSLSPNWASALANRGFAYLVSERHAEALADFNAALRLTPNDGATLFQRGRAHYALEDYAAASKDFTAALALSPQDASTRLWRARALAHLDRLDAAIADIDAALPALDEQTLKDYQRLLANKGLDPGPIDGAYGPGTRNAMIACARATCF